MLASLVVLSIIAMGSKLVAIDAPPPQKEDFAEATPERRVAMMDARCWLPDFDPGVDRARVLLERVDELYFDGTHRIAEVTETFWRDIRSRGSRVSATEILEGTIAWAEARPDRRRRRFIRVASYYTTCRQRGMSHAKALEALKDAAKTDVWRGW